MDELKRNRFQSGRLRLEKLYAHVTKLKLVRQSVAFIEFCGLSVSDVMPPIDGLYSSSTLNLHEHQTQALHSL